MNTNVTYRDVGFTIITQSYHTVLQNKKNNKKIKKTVEYTWIIYTVNIKNFQDIIFMDFIVA